MYRTELNASRSEKGQAMVLIVLAIVAMLGFAALAIDLGMIYSDRGAAQNAADSAAMSAAYTLCTGGNHAALVTAATNMVATNGFTDNSATTNTVNVTVNHPPVGGSYVGDNTHIEVVIKVKRKPIFAQFIYNGPIETTVRAVSRCEIGSGGSATVPGLGGEVSMLALSKTASGAVTNTGAAEVIVDGGVFINSTATNAMKQNGSAILKMNWAKIRGGADLGGAFGVYTVGSGTVAKQIDIVKDLVTSGAGQAVAGAFNIGGSVSNNASINMTGNPMNVGGNFNNTGAATVVSSQLLIVGNVTNRGSGSFTSEVMLVGGSIDADGASWFKPASGKTQQLTVKGNIVLGGSAQIGQTTSDSLYQEGLLTKGSGAVVKSTRTTTLVAQPAFSVSIPEMADPLATVLQPPTQPTGSCTNVSFPSYGSYTAPVTTGGYYCGFDVGGSLTAVIPPGTYWVDYFALGGAATLKMDGVHLFITGKNHSSAFSVGGSGSISMAGTMLYLKTGSFSFSGAGGTLKWTAPGSGDTYQGLSLYLDRANGSTASLSGSAAISALSGTWYAPASACSFTGATNTVVYSQFICNTIQVTGSSKLTIKYDSTLVYQVSTEGGAPEVSLDE
jgi:hypothetical protein